MLVAYRARYLKKRRLSHTRYVAKDRAAEPLPGAAFSWRRRLGFTLWRVPKEGACDLISEYERKRSEAEARGICL